MPDHKTLESYFTSPDRLENTDQNVLPIALQRISMVYESDRVKLAPPPPGSVRQACIYTFYADVEDWEQGRLEYEMEDMMAAAPGVWHFSAGNEIWAQELADEEGIKSA